MLLACDMFPDLPRLEEDVYSEEEKSKHTKIISHHVTIVDAFKEDDAICQNF